MLYIDTDGIFTRNKIPQKMTTTTKELGKFRLESENKNAYFIANKFYIYTKINNQYKAKLKGINNQTHIYKIEDIIKQYVDIINTTKGLKIIIFNLNIQKKQHPESKYIFKASRKRKLIDNYKTTPWIIIQS